MGKGLVLSTETDGRPHLAHPRLGIEGNAPLPWTNVFANRSKWVTSGVVKCEDPGRVLSFLCFPL
jgi:hypothetical protein